MRLTTSDLRLSPSDLSAFLGCRHRTGLDLAVAAGSMKRPEWTDPMTEALRRRGAEHERAFAESLRRLGLGIVEIDQEQPPDARVAQTLEAMRSGAEVIVQAALEGASWLGYADILQRVSTPSALGDWSYEPYDTKLARETRGGTILQLSVYVDLLEGIQQVRPKRFWVVTPGDDEAPFVVTPYRYADFAAYVRVVRAQLSATLALGHDAIRQSYYPEPVEGCEVCRWIGRCDKRRRTDDHLSFIAGIGRAHREELTAQGFATLATAAAMPLPIAFKPSRGSRDTYTRIREQARVQHEQRTLGRPVHELLLPVVEGQGLSRLPDPSPGDLFLDLEGARFAREGGREYLFGLWGRPAGAPAASRQYEGLWAFTDADERTAFEATIDRIMQTLAADPGAHIYHFGHYEPSTFKRLMGRYATRAEQLDELLRGERFVDLYAVVRQALRAGVESYSIKKLEQFYGFTRAFPLHDAAVHLQTDRAGAGGQRASGHSRRSAGGGRARTTRTTAGQRRRCASGWNACARSSRRRALRCHGRPPKTVIRTRRSGNWSGASKPRESRLLEGVSGGSLQPGSRAASALAPRVPVGLAPSRGQVGVVGVLPAARLAGSRSVR